MNPLQCKLVTFTRDLSLASGDVSYSGILTFRPRGIIFLACVDAGYSASYGVDQSTGDLGIMDGANGSNQLKFNMGHAIGIYPSAGNGVYGNTKQMLDDGFVITYTKEGSPTGVVGVIAMCFGP